MEVYTFWDNENQKSVTLGCSEPRYLADTKKLENTMIETGFTDA